MSKRVLLIAAILPLALSACGGAASEDEAIAIVQEYVREDCRLSDFGFWIADDVEGGWDVRSSGVEARGRWTVTNDGRVVTRSLSCPGK